MRFVRTGRCRLPTGMLLGVQQLALFFGQMCVRTVVVAVDDFVQDLVYFRFVLQVDGVLLLQRARADRPANARLRAHVRVEDEIVEHFRPRVMAWDVVVVVGRDLLQLMEEKVLEGEGGRMLILTLGKA